MISEEIATSNTQEAKESVDPLMDFLKNIHETKESIEFSTIKQIRTSVDNDTSILNANLKGISVTPKKKEFVFSEIDSEGITFLNEWKIISVFPARITEITNSSVLLEVIIDEDEIEEQEYGMKFFEGFDLNKINFFKIKCYERAREQRLVMTDASKSLKRNDFPIVDFSHIKNTDLFF